MEYLANGAVITNRLLFTDQRRIDDIMGGGGFYAYSALRMCTPDCLLVAGVGDDFDEFYGEWFKRNNCSKDGLYITVDKTTYNELVYDAEGGYDEYSIYGREYERENFPKTVLGAACFAPFVDDAKGLYTGDRMDDHFVEVLLELKKGRDFKVMWEIPESAVDELARIYKANGIAGLKEKLCATDIFSLNKPESYRVFGCATIEDAINRLIELDMPAYYRIGTKGAYMIDGGKAYHVPMISTVPKEQELDPTGCGNSSTAAAMWACCEGYDPLMVCAIGNAVASYNVRQYGPYPDMSRDTFEDMIKTAESVCKAQKTAERSRYE